MNQRKGQGFSKQTTREEIDRALKEFRNRGGRINRIEPKWIEDSHTPGYISHKRHH